MNLVVRDENWSIIRNNVIYILVGSFKQVVFNCAVWQNWITSLLKISDTEKYSDIFLESSFPLHLKWSISVEHLIWKCEFKYFFLQCPFNKDSFRVNVNISSWYVTLSSLKKKLVIKNSYLYDYLEFIFYISAGKRAQ